MGSVNVTQRALGMTSAGPASAGKPNLELLVEVSGDHPKVQELLRTLEAEARRATAKEAAAVLAPQPESRSHRHPTGDLTSLSSL
jgi:hypothetical protein